MPWILVMVDGLFCVVFILYFRTAIYNATNHPIPVHPNSQLYIRIHAVAVLFFLFWRANHAGAKIIVIIMIMANIYLTYKKIKFIQFIFYKSGGVFCPPYTLFTHIINRILPICPVLLRYEPIGCILPCGRCVT